MSAPTQLDDSGVAPGYREVAVTPGQQLLPFMAAVRPGGAGGSFNISLRLRIDGALDTAALERALRQIVARHEALRTAVVGGRGMPVQRIHDHADVGLQQKDSSPANVSALLAGDNRRAFELEHAPLCRALLLTLSESSWVLQVTAHHGISDAWSLELVQRDIGAYYRAELGLGEPPAPVRRPYGAYVQEIVERLASNAGRRAREFWTRHLADGLKVPPRRVRVRGGFEHGTSRQTIAFTGEESAQLMRATAGAQLTPFMAMASVHAVLLGTLTDSADVSIPTFSSGRTSARDADLVGMLVNPMWLQASFAGKERFWDAARVFKATCVGAYEFQDFPMIEVLGACPEVELTIADPRNALMPIQLYRSWSPDVGGLLGPGCVARRYETDRAGRANALPLDALLTVKVLPDRLSATLNTALDLWSEAEARGLCVAFKEACLHAARERDVTVARLRQTIERQLV